jgi:P-type Ca2+ transporter type 2C
VEVSGSGYLPKGELTARGAALGDGPLRQEVEVVLRGGSLANDAVLSEQAGSWTLQGDPTDGALLVAERKAQLTSEREQRFERVAELPFTSERKLMSTIARDASRTGKFLLVTKGAPDVLVERCSSERAGDRVVPLGDDRREQIQKQVDTLSDRALRTLAVAYRLLPGGEVPDTSRPGVEEELERDLVFAGVVGMIDPAGARRPKLASFEASRPCSPYANGAAP